MANPLAAQQVGRAHRIAEADQAAAPVGLLASDRAADQAAMAIQHFGSGQAAAGQDRLQQGAQGRLGPIRVLESTDPHLEPAGLHREHPAVALGQPVRAQQKTELAAPALLLGRRHRQQPLHPQARHQGACWGRGLPEQATGLAGGIHQPAALDPALLAIAPAQQGANAIRPLVLL